MHGHTRGTTTRRRVVEVRYSRLAALLACAALMGGVAACGDDDEGGGGSGGAGTEETGTTEGAKAVDPASMENASGDVTVCMGKDTAGDIKQAHQGVQRGGQRRDRQAGRVLDVRRRAARAVRPAPGGQVGRVRHLLVRRDLDRGVRVPEVADGHDALRRDAQGRDHSGDARDGHLRRQDLGHAAADRRGVPLLPHGPGRHAARHVAGRSTRTRARRTASSTRARRTRA